MSRATSAVVALGFGAVVALPALAQEEEPFFARLGGLEEVPSVSTPANGSFFANLGDGVLDYKLRYDGIRTPVLFAHIHLGEARTNAASVRFCATIPVRRPRGRRPVRRRAAKLPVR